MIHKTLKLDVIKKAREWARAERRLRASALTYGEEKEWVVRESDRTEEELLAAVHRLEREERQASLYPHTVHYVPPDLYPRGYDIRLSEISRAYIEKLYELSTKLEEIKAPPPGQVVTIHAPFHTIEFHPHREPKCKECGK